LETLNVKGMQQNHNLAQSIGDSAWSSFVTKLEYKAQWFGKTILRIGQFEPPLNSVMFVDTITQN